ncbi:uncharacterized protein LOC110308483 [Mus caroli]|uniref:Uncharacterized protein LOC110308483 n=1 Tax=Mus caroli TaxID=10089 RepID=A0A6P5QXQ2_MUSCR|nr:uncharacterized protein LOC110308483 [Mus caroli]
MGRLRITAPEMLKSQSRGSGRKNGCWKGQSEEETRKTEGWLGSFYYPLEVGQLATTENSFRVRGMKLACTPTSIASVHAALSSPLFLRHHGERTSGFKRQTPLYALLLGSEEAAERDSPTTVNRDPREPQTYVPSSPDSTSTVNGTLERLLLNHAVLDPKECSFGF